MVGVRQFNEAAVMEQALDLFWRQGFAATSMPGLAEATGVQRGSLYNAYGGKEGVFLRAFDLYTARFLDAARTALGRPDPEEALAGFFAMAIASMTAGSPARGCLSTKTAMDGAAWPQVRDRVERLLDDLAAIVRATLSTPQAAGRLTLPPEEAAQLLVTFTRGLAVMERVHGDPDRLRQTAAALIKTLLARQP